MDLKVHFCVCHAFSTSLIMISHKPSKRENAMNGLSDVRLALQAEELQDVAGVGQVQTQAAAKATLSVRWQQFYRRLSTRRGLLKLTPEQLKDVGLSPEQARREALRPFWTL